jgi:hypothetical protein
MVMRHETNFHLHNININNTNISRRQDLQNHLFLAMCCSLKSRILVEVELDHEPNYEMQPINKARLQQDAILIILLQHDNLIPMRWVSPPACPIT